MHPFTTDIHSRSTRIVERECAFGNDESVYDRSRRWTVQTTGVFVLHGVAFFPQLIQCGFDADGVLQHNHIKYQTECTPLVFLALAIIRKQDRDRNRGRPTNVMRLRARGIPSGQQNLEKCFMLQSEAKQRIGAFTFQLVFYGAVVDGQLRADLLAGLPQGDQLHDPALGGS
jgi:hypothetical protein